MSEKKQYTDEEIRKMRRITPLVVSQYLDAFPSGMSVALAMRDKVLPIGVAIENKDTGRWTYRIEAERLIAYKHGTIPRADLDALERKLDEFIHVAQKTLEEYRAERAMMMQ